MGLFGRNVELNGCLPLKNWRKIAIGTWTKPNDAQMLGRVDLDVTEILKFLEQKSKESGYKITPTHFIVKAVGLVLEHNPDLNSPISWKKIYLRKNVDIFTHVATGEDGRDLSGIRLANVNKKSIAVIAEEVSNKAKKIKANHDELLGKSKKMMQLVPWFMMDHLLNFISFFQFTLNLSPKIFGLPKDAFGSAMVTSLGQNDVEFGIGPLVPWSRVPLIVMVGRIQEKAIVKNGEIVKAPIMALGVTLDHRHVDGFIASKMVELSKEAAKDPWKFFN